LDSTPTGAAVVGRNAGVLRMSFIALLARCFVGELRTICHLLSAKSQPLNKRDFNPEAIKSAQQGDRRRILRR
jgi:hypothetical protein